MDRNLNKQEFRNRFKKIHYYIVFFFINLLQLCCIAGTAIYLRPLEPYLDAPIFGILVPTFISGYIIVHSIEIFILIMNKEYVFLVSKWKVKCKNGVKKTDRVKSFSIKKKKKMHDYKQEICFVVIGGMGCIICGTYQLLKWVNWIIGVLHEEHNDDYKCV